MRVASYSDCGGRACNEDSIQVVCSEDYICAILADGLGGHGGGAVASQTAVKVITSELKESDVTDITKENVREWCQKANLQIIAGQTDDCKMKSTIALLFYKKKEKQVIIAHVGDSRVYQFVNDSCEFCTFDHSVSRMAVVTGEITMDQIRHHVDRNKLLRSLGGNKEVKVEIDVVDLVPNEINSFLLCSDGFWEYVTEDVMKKTLQQSGDSEAWLSEMRKCVHMQAPAGNDNHSAIAIQIEEE